MTPHCPRCGSINTKFCYYNNYSLTQPRYFCKGCRRYWTKGGNLRNVPIGGGCRKSRSSRPWSSLRLASSNHHHHHRTICSQGETNSDYNAQLGHNSMSSYVKLRNSTNMVDEESITNTKAQPIIDLAVVYDNFMNQKPDKNGDSSMVDNLPKLDQVISSGFSSVPLLDDIHINHMGPSSQLAMQQPNASMLVDSRNYIKQYSSPQAVVMPPSSNEQISIGLPPLPWDPSSSSSSDCHPGNCNLDAPGLMDLEPEPEPELVSDTQFSNVILGSWSPLDLPGFENFSSKLD